jgi:hypothetical protein
MSKIYFIFTVVSMRKHYQEIIKIFLSPILLKYTLK